jgi:hypothetical protein
MTSSFDERMKKLESWTGEDGEKIIPGLIEYVTAWFRDIERRYVAKYGEPVPDPEPLPGAADEMSLEWTVYSGSKREAVLLAGFLFNGAIDYYGEEKRTGSSIHGMLPGTDEEKESIVAFLHDHLKEVVAGTVMSGLEESMKDGRESLERCLVPDWGGDDERPITPEMMERAFAFARDVDAAYRSKHGRPAPVPDFGAYGGDPPNVELEWEEKGGSRPMVLAASVRSDHVSYFGEIGDRKHWEMYTKGERKRDEAINEIINFMHEGMK